jgi:hypothetical protein
MTRIGQTHRVKYIIIIMLIYCLLNSSIKQVNCVRQVEVHCVIAKSWDLGIVGGFIVGCYGRFGALSL